MPDRVRSCSAVAYPGGLYAFPRYRDLRSPPLAGYRTPRVVSDPDRSWAASPPLWHLYVVRRCAGCDLNLGDGVAASFILLCLSSWFRDSVHRNPRQVQRRATQSPEDRAMPHLPYIQWYYCYAGTLYSTSVQSSSLTGN